MRVTDGIFKGRALSAPKGRSTRPTSAQTRQMIFNVLTHAPWSAGVVGARAMDLYAGSGALGIEALSRAAAACLFVESARTAVAAIGTNIATLGLVGQADVRNCRVEDIGRRPRGIDPFDLVLVDPPYRADPSQTLRTLVAGEWLDADAVVAVQTGAPVTAPWPGYRLVASHASGAAIVTFVSPEPRP